MSLVNDMLKDLDARKAEGDTATQGDDVTADLKPVTRRKPFSVGANVPKRTWVMIGLAVVLGVGLAVDFLLPKKKTPPVPQVMTMESDAGAAVAENATETTEAPVPPALEEADAPAAGVADAEPSAEPNAGQVERPEQPVPAEPVAVVAEPQEPAPVAEVKSPAETVQPVAQEHKETQAPAASEPKKQADATDEKSKNKGKVGSINVAQEDTRTTVRFVMERFATYTLTNKDPGRLRIWFRDTKLPANTPQVSPGDILKKITRGATEKSDFYDVEFAADAEMNTEYVADASGETAGTILVKIKAPKGAAVAAKPAPKTEEPPSALPQTAVATDDPLPSAAGETAGALSLDTPAPADVDVAVDHGERADNLWQAGLNRLRRGDTTGGKAALRAALRAEPQHVEARVALVNQLIKERRLEEARESLDEGLAVDASEPELALRWARLAVDSSNTEGAIRALEEASGRAQDNWEFQTFLAALYQRNGSVTKSASIYEAAVAQHPQRGDWWFGLGLAQDSQGKSQSALAAYQKALRDKRLPPALRDFANKRIAGP